MNARADFPLGLVPDLGIQAYHAAAGISNSGLADFARSPAHYFALHLDPERPPREEKAGQLEGNLAHCAILEPAAFEQRYVSLPADAPRRPSEAQWNAKKPSPESVAAMEWWSNWSETTGGATVITHAQRQTAMAQAARVRRLAEVAALLARGAPEVSAFWTDPATGELCRCRPDWVHPVDGQGVILLDVKTCGDASPREFARQVARKGYHRQAALYSDGYAIASGQPVLGFVFAAVESTWPYAASAVMLDDEGLAKGRAEIAEMLPRFAECRRSGVWPGYSEAIELVALPAWALAA